MAHPQEYYKGEAEDNGEVLALDQHAHRARRRLRQPATDSGHHPARTRRARTQVLCPGVGLVLTIDQEDEGREELLAVTRVSTDEARRAGRVPLPSPTDASPEPHQRATQWLKCCTPAGPLSARIASDLVLTSVASIWQPVCATGMYPA